MLVKEIMSKDVVCCTTATPVTKIAVLMKIHDLGLTPVLHESTRFLAGIITDRDLCLHVLTGKSQPEHFLADQCMSGAVTFCKPDDTVEMALQKMGEARVRRLPVVEKEMLVGILGISDVIRNNAVKPAKIIAALRKIYVPAAAAKAAKAA